MIRRSARIGPVIIMTLLLIAVFSPGRPAQAATIIVDGICTLPDAIIAANTNAASGSCSAGSGPDTIELQVDVALTAVAETNQGPNGLVSVTSTIIINGNGHTISRTGGSPDFRIFRVTTGGTLTLNNLTITGGLLTTGDFTSGSGGGIRVNGGTATLNSVTMTGNTALQFGGALEHVNGTVTINNSTFTNNTTTSGGGALDTWASGTGASSSMTVNNTVINNNQAVTNGGAIYIGGGSATSTVDLNQVTITNNTASNLGGAIRILGNDSSSIIVRITETTIDNNDSAFGGAIYTDIGNGNAVTVTVLNSTLSNNTATSWGGGIFNTSTTVNVHQSTLSGNVSSGDGGDIYTNGGTVNIIQSTLANAVAPDGGGIYTFGGATANVSNSIVASNSPTTCAGTGTINNQGNNIADDTTCPFGIGVNLNPLLQALANNGGPTRTHALGAGSPALGRGNSGVCSNTPVNGVDQRGVSRPQGGGSCDSGAYESSNAGIPIHYFSQATYSVTEGNGGGFTTNATVRVNRTNNTSVASSVQIALSNGPAPAATGGGSPGTGIDYDNDTITVNFGAGSTFQDVNIPIAADAVDEGSENLTLALINPSPGAVGGPSSAVLTINDDDTAGVSVTQSGDSTVIVEGGATDTISIVLNSQPSTGTVTIMADPGEQCGLGGGVGTPVVHGFNAGTWSDPWNLTVTAFNDTVVEGNHSCLIELSISASTTPEYPVSLGVSDVTAAVTDNDTATVSLASATSSINAADSPHVTNVVLTTNPPGATLGAAVNFSLNRANVTTSGADFSGATTVSGNFGAGTADGATRTVTTPINDEALAEADETFTLTLSNVTGPATLGSPSVQTVTLVSDDSAPVAVNDSYNTLQDQTLNVQVANGVLNNDSDGDNDPLTASLVSGPSHAAPGGFTFQTNGSFSYTPAAGFDGADTFTYRASDGTNNSAPATVTINVAIPIPPAPVLIAPADGSITTNNFPAFDWNAAAYAATYEIQVDNAADFSSPALDSTGTEHGLTAPTGLADKTLYYWRVRGINANDEEGDWSVVWTISINTTPPAPPQLRSPKDLSNSPDTTPRFTWTRVKGGVEYKLEVDDNANFSSLLDIGTTLLTSTSYTVPNDKALPYGHYFWRVQVREANGQWSEWSTVGTFTITIHTRPVNGDFTTDPTPTFTWAKVQDAVQYELQVDTDPNFGTVPLPASFVGNANKFTPATNLLPGYYYWRVRVDTGAGFGGWMPVWVLSITPSPGAKPKLLAPANQSVATVNTLNFSWEDIDDNETYSYQIQIDENANFATPVQDHVGAPDELLYAADPLADGTYFWRVRGINGVGVAGQWSTTWRFTVDTTPPVAPSLISPANLSALSDTTPKFSWERIKDAKTYHLLVSTDPALTSPIVDQDGIKSPAYAVPNANALPNGTYFWGVMAQDAAGNVGLLSTVFTFTLTDAPVLPDAPIQQTPPDDTITQVLPNPFDWDTVTNGDTYQIQIDNDKKFGSPEQDVTGASGVTTYDAAPLADGTYYWRVRAITVGGVAGEWSEVWRFTLDTTAPAAPDLKSPKNGEATHSVRPVDTWRGPRDIAFYHLQVATDPGFGTPLVQETTLTGSKFTQPTALAHGHYYWRMRAEDSLGNLGAWGDVYSFTVTILQSPKDGSTTGSDRPTFKWYKTDNALGYCLQVDNNADFLSPEIDELGLTQTGFRPATGLPDGLYNWRVSVDTGLGCTTWMEVWTFTITPKPPKKVKLESPTQKWLTSDNTPTMTWKPVTDVAQYQLQLDDDKGFGSPAVDVLIDGTTVFYTANVVPDATYYWRVRALNSVNVPGPWSTVWFYTVDTTPTLAPDLVSPADGTRVTNKHLTLEWTKVDGAVRYEIQIDTDPGFLLPALDAGNKTSYKPNASLAQATYHWRVRTIDAAGNVSAWSTAWTFNLIAGNTAGEDGPVLVPQQEPVLIPLEPPTASPPVENPDGAPTRE